MSVSPEPIERLTETAIHTLRRALAAVPCEDPHGDGPSLALLIDPARHDPLGDDPLASSAERIRLSINTLDRTHTPYLLPLKGAHQAERLLNTSLRQSIQECLGLYDCDGLRPRSLCAWLIPAQQPAQPTHWRQVSLALSDRAWVKPPAPQPRTLVRFWDPRITTQLPTTLGHDPWHTFLQAAAVQQWWTFEADATLVRVGQTQVGQTAALQGQAAPSPQLPPHWELDSPQWQALRLLASRNVIAQAATSWPLAQPPHAQDLDAIVRRAFGHGLHHRADLIAFAHLALTAHPLFDTHPQVAQALDDWKHAGRPDAGFALRAQAWREDLLPTLQSGAWLRQDGGASAPSSSP